MVGCMCSKRICMRQLEDFYGVKVVRAMMVEKGICKPPGCSMIEVGDFVHGFIVVADKTPPISQEIYSLLDESSRKLKMASYVPIALDEEGSQIKLCAESKKRRKLKI